MAAASKAYTTDDGKTSVKQDSSSASQMIATSTKSDDGSFSSSSTFSSSSMSSSSTTTSSGGPGGMYSIRNLDRTISFSLKSRPSEQFHRPEMSQIKAWISLRTNVKLIFHKNKGWQGY